MFGISFWKIVVLVAVIAVVWFGYRWAQRWDQERRAQEVARARLRRREPGADKNAEPVSAEDMVACRVCGVYVAAHQAKSCGRANCPY